MRSLWQGGTAIPRCLLLGQRRHSDRAVETNPTRFWFLHQCLLYPVLLEAFEELILQVSSPEIHSEEVLEVKRTFIHSIAHVKKEVMWKSKEILLGAQLPLDYAKHWKLFAEIITCVDSIHWICGETLVQFKYHKKYWLFHLLASRILSPPLP